jgi:phosphate transport system permease protein
VEFYVKPGAPADANGTPAKPFDTIQAAANAMARLEHEEGASGRAIGSPNRVDLVYLLPQGQERGTSSRPRFNYWVDSEASEDKADGSQSRPWPSLEAAARRLRELHDANGSSLQDGERIRIWYRHAFGATGFEQSKTFRQEFIKYVLLGMALCMVVPLVGILTYLLVKAWPILSWSFLVQNPQNRMTAGGLWAPLVGTFLLVLLSLVIAAPVGIAAGIYLNEYAPNNWLKRIVMLGVVNLAGVPSIVHGLFGVGAFVYFARLNPSLLAAACTVAVMTLPVIITSTREALASVPMSFRQACWNLGASRWQTIRTIVLPNSISGILTGVILQVARAAGETAPILFTGAVFYVRVADTGLSSYVPYGPDDKFMALSYHLFALSTMVKGVSEELQFGTAVVLIGLVLLVNSLSIVFRLYLRSHKKW